MGTKEMTYKYFSGAQEENILRGLPNIYRHNGRETYLLMEWGTWSLLCSGTVEEVESLFKPITEKQVKSIIIKRTLKK